MTALNNVKVRFVVTGANPNSGSATTDANGKASYTYTAVTAAPTPSGLCRYRQRQRTGCDRTRCQHQCDLDRGVTDLEPVEHERLRSARRRPSTATLKNANNQPIAGITVRFTVTGANPTTINVVTNSSGQASFSYTGTKAGTDTIHAYGDLDSDGVQDGGDPASNVTLNWTTTPTPPAVKPSSPASPKAGCTYFPQTQHNLCAGFSAYWNQFGGSGHLRLSNDRRVPG